MPYFRLTLCPAYLFHGLILFLSLSLLQLSPEVLESFILDLGCYGSADINPPIVLAGEMARDLQAE